MADLEAVLRNMKQLKRETLDFNEAIGQVSAATEDFIKKGSTLTGSGNRAGTVWSLISRMSVGTGFHRVEANIRSIAFVLKLINQTREKEAKSDAAAMRTADMVVTYQTQSMRLLQNIGKLRDGEISTLEKETILQDKNVKFMIQRYKMAKGMQKIEERAQFLRKSSARLRRKSRGISRGDIVRENSGFFKGLRGMDYEIGADLVFAQDRRREVRERKGRIQGMVTKGEVALDKYDAQIEEKQQLIDKLPSSGKETMIARRQLRKLQQKRRLRAEQQEAQELILLELTEEDAVLTGDIVESKKALAKKGYEISDDEEYLNLSEAPDRENDDKPLWYKVFGVDTLKKAKNLIQGKINKAVEGVQKFYTGGSLKMILSFVSKGALLFGQVLLWVSLLGAVVYLLKTSGVLDGIIKMWKEGIFGKIWKEGFNLFLSGVIDIYMGIKDFIIAIFDVLSALYKGEGLVDAFGNLVEKFALMIGKVLLGIGKILVGIIVMAISAQMIILLGALNGLYQKGRELVLGPLSPERRQASKDAIQLAYQQESQGGITDLVSAKTKRLGRNIGQNFGFRYDKDGRNILGMASGGTVRTGGVFTVGERGPEAVFLPAGTSVLNNTQTRNMGGNTINVSVNGRVGATDQELNELARKLGEKINREMNRYSNSGLRG